MRNKRIFLGAIMLLLLSFSSCRMEDKKNDFGSVIHIVTTTGIIEDAITNIVKDSAEVTSLMGPGTDPHLYKPTPYDIELLDEADIIICNGLHLEGKMADLLSDYSAEKPVISVSEGIASDKLIKSTDLKDAYDPHIWFDPDLWMEGMKYVTDTLKKLDESSAGYYGKNFSLYAAKVDEMVKWTETEIAQLKDSSRVLITSHDAFSYFGRRFGITVKGIQGISTLSEVGLKDISEMVDFVIARQVKSIFIETSTSDKTAQSIVDGTEERGYALRLEGPLYSDALGEPDASAGTYVGMVRENVKIIVNGLK